MSWKPIDDHTPSGKVVLTDFGTAILVPGYQYLHSGRIESLMWYLCDWDGYIPVCAEEGREVSAISPTHWQPLPEPPSELPHTE